MFSVNTHLIGAGMMILEDSVCLYIPSINLVILVIDGEQHFTQVSNWDAQKNVHKIDIEKEH